MALNNLIFSSLWSEYDRVLTTVIMSAIRSNLKHLHLCTHRLVQSMPLNKSPACHNPEFDDQKMWSSQEIAWHFIPVLILRFHADYTLRKVIHNFPMHLTEFRHFLIILLTNSTVVVTDPRISTKFAELSKVMTIFCWLEYTYLNWF